MIFFKFTTIAILLSAIFSCFSKPAIDCNKFRNGIFSFYSEQTKYSYLVNRKDSLQIETEKETGKITEWKVTWLNDCEYNLLLTKDNYGLLKSGKLKKIPTFNYEIISSTNNYYIFKFKLEPSQSVITDTIWKIN